VAGATTRPAADRPADLIRRHFSPAAPDLLWVADFTHIPTWPCMVYVAFVIHARSRRIPGLTRPPVDQDGETVPVSRPG
jgi:putative transposase